MNRQLKCKPYIILKINEMLLKLEGFQYAKLRGLNMGYYHKQLAGCVSNLCTIIIPWVKYRYKCLPMGVSNSPELFQQKMDHLSQVFSFIHEYIYDLLFLTKGY